MNQQQTRPAALFALAAAVPLSTSAALAAEDKPWQDLSDDAGKAAVILVNGANLPAYPFRTDDWPK